MAGDGQAEHNKRPGKKVFLGAELAAYAICKDVPELGGRKVVSGYAIDCAEPNDPMDRDDAVRVEYAHDAVLGRLTILHVTIADVAAVVPRASEREVDRRLGALDEAARTKGQTKYYAHGSRPMFPRRLQDRMSLENNKERAGLTISITYDEHCNRIHTEFARTRIAARCKTYREASDNILEKNGSSNAMQHIALLAKNLLKRQPGTVNLPYYDEQTGMYTDTEGHARHISSEASSSYVAVQGCMIAAGEAVADVMSKSNFLFRNHCGKESDLDGAREFYSKAERGANAGKLFLGAAEYAGECKGHYGLGSAHYSHVTSPIRRYADVVNQRMQHWAVDVVESVVKAARDKLDGRQVTCTPERLSYLVWDQAQELMGKATAFKEAGRNRKKIDAGKQLEDTISHILLPVMGEVLSKMAAQAALRNIDTLELPYTQKEIGVVARGLNEKSRKRWAGVNGDELMNATLDAIFIRGNEPDEDGFVPDPEHKEEAIRRRRPFKFAELLEAAARRGDNNDFFAQEVERRLISAEDRGELVRNLYTLLVIADKEKDSRWQVLKRDAFQMLKDDAILAQRVFNHLQAQSKPPKAFILETSLLDKEGRVSPAALVVFNHENVDYSAPMLDTGETAEAARIGAILTFFRHFGRLSAHEELYTPKRIDLALGRARVKKGERLSLLSRICGEEFTLETFAKPDAHHEDKADFTLRVTRKANGEMLEKTRNGWAHFGDDYFDKCAKDMIEDYRFVDMLSQSDFPGVAGVGQVTGAQMLFSRRRVQGGGASL